MRRVGRSAQPAEQVVKSAVAPLPVDAVSCRGSRAISTSSASTAVGAMTRGGHRPCAESDDQIIDTGALAASGVGHLYVVQPDQQTALPVAPQHRQVSNHEMIRSDALQHSRQARRQNAKRHRTSRKPHREQSRQNDRNRDRAGCQPHKQVHNSSHSRLFLSVPRHPGRFSVAAGEFARKPSLRP